MHQPLDALCQAGAGHRLRTADHGSADRLEIRTAPAMGEIDHDGGIADGRGDCGLVADAAAAERDARIGEKRRQVDGVARHHRHRMPSRQ